MRCDEADLSTSARDEAGGLDAAVYYATLRIW
jgi:hypothetical protein